MKFTIVGKNIDITEGLRSGVEDKIGKLIFDKLKPWMKSGLNAQVEKLLQVLRRECWMEELPRYEDRIMLADGTLWIDGGFTEDLTQLATSRADVLLVDDR